MDEIKLNRRLIIYEANAIKNLTNGRILGTDNKIKGYARVVQVMPDLSKAKIVNSVSQDIKLTDKVITE